MQAGADHDHDHVHVHVLDAQLAHGESCLVDAGCLGSCSQDVRLDGNVVGVCYSLDLFEKATRVRAVPWAGRDRPNVLWGRVHEVEFARVLEHLADAAVAPQRGDGLANTGVEGFFRVRVDGVLDEVVAVLVVARDLGLDLELAHGANEGLRAVDDVLVDGQAVHGQLLLCVAILVDDLHLLDDGRFAAFAGACSAC
jgi:hypothetical protein